VWFRIAFCVVLGGCGFQSRAGLLSDLPPDGDGSGAKPPDAGVDGGSSGQTGCFQRWFDGSLALTQVKELTALASAGDDRDPWISADGLRLYFGRSPGPHGGSDIFLATRTSTAADFPDGVAVDNLDTPDDESRAALSGDEKLLVFSGTHNTAGGNFQLFVSTRGDTNQPFPSPSNPDQALLGSVNTTGDRYFDPFLSRDGLRLYLAPILAGSQQQIRLATRTALDRNFGPSAAVAVINSGSTDADPALSLDERVIVFSSKRPAGGLGGTNLWYSTRPNAMADFAPPKLIPSVNGDQDDGDPVLSADGCELYFSSTRVGGKHHLFHAQVTP
jgi:Tol biopolymer transport system component